MPRFGHTSRVDSRRLVAISRRNGGLFTREQAKQCGYSEVQIRHRVQRGEWVRVLGRVLAPATLLVSATLRDLAASLAIKDSVLAGPSAARSWRIPIDDARTCVYVGSSGHTHLRGIKALHAMPPDADIRRINGVRVTGRARTVVDCALLLPERQAIELLDLALVRRWITLDDVAEQIHARAGCRGVRKLVAVMRLLADGTHSAAERLAADLFRRNNVTRWKANAPVRCADEVLGLGDFVFETAKLVVEIDGLAFHCAPADFGLDRERQNRIILAGWRVLRLTWYDLRYRPQYVIETVLAELAKA
jgi:very-short-patch-repair endonuclease